MILKKIEINNFFIVGHIELDLRDRGLVLVLGENLDTPSCSSNGAGKSFVFVDSFLWVIWGRVLNPPKYADSVVNRQVGKDCSVILYFQDEAGTEYCIERYRKHKKHGNSLYLFVNQQNVTSSSVRETQAQIDEIIGVPYETFLNTTIFSAVNAKKFTSMTDAEQKQALEKVLELGWLTEYGEKVKEKWQHAYTRLSDTWEAIHQQEGIIDEYKELLENAAEESKEYRAKKANELKALQDRQLELEDEISKRTSEVVRLNNEQKIDREYLSELEEDEKTYTSKVLTLTGKLAVLQRKKLESYEQCEELYDEREHYKELRGHYCETCGQLLSKKDADQTLEEIRDEIETAVARRDKLDKSLKKMTRIYKKTQRALAETKKAIAEATREIYQRATQKARDKKDFERVCEEHDRLEKEIENFNIDEDNPWFKSIDNYARFIEEKYSKLTLLKMREDALEHEVEVLDFWKEGFSNRGIRSLILDEVAEKLNQGAKKYTKFLTANAIGVQFSTQTELKSGEKREKFQVETTNISGSEEYVTNSIGEKTRIDLVVALAISSLLVAKHSAAFNIMVFDETLGNLDEAGIDLVMELLIDLAREKESIFVISHNANLNERFRDILTVRREGGIASLE